MEDGKGLVCVSGGTGFVASWLIMRLLEHGYTVRTTIRSSPEPEEVITKRAVDGTLGVLRACVNAKTVKRVVCASSQATVIYSGDGDEKVVDESSWTNIDYYRSLNRFGTSYLVAKNETERAALDFAEQYGLDLVFLIPPLIVGPFICPRIPESVRWSLSLIFGEKQLYNLLIKLNVVHTDDVARAYIFLLEFPHVKGSSLKDIKGFKMRGLSPKKLLDCGFKFEHGLEDMFDGAIQSCKEKGFL
ncbi:hypothetical protein POTOM_008290 [Populus tomentosa]|uniref:NAD-dependent epimerase/dehydratase domain-containing protein n=1 Tax=Populus tomentosa TaxID=118781 RepID=A0A8X8DCE7_POPTO|nr:hypothetical protein POTOM_008290 [Populus tomentosa]